MTVNVAPAVRNNIMVSPDLTTQQEKLSAAVCRLVPLARKKLCNISRQQGPVYQAALSSNPIAMVTSLACRNELKKVSNRQRLAQLTETAQGLKALAQKHEIPLVINYVGGMFGFFFTRIK